MSTATLDAASPVTPAKQKVMLVEGNEAAALGVALARPDMVAVYPITPQSSLVEHVAKLIADGRMDADIVDAEGEHSVLSVLQGGALAGARTYTATCGPGLAFMFEPYFRTSGMRLPIVMSIVTRDGITPQSVKSNIKEIVDSVYEKDHVTVSIGKGRDGKEQVHVGENLAAVIKDIEKQMREAATNLEFERAAKLRDEIKRLREMELDVLEGSGVTD